MLFCKTYDNVLLRQPDHYTTSLLKLLLCLFGHFAFDMKARLSLLNVLLLLPKYQQVTWEVRGSDFGWDVVYFFDMFHN